MASGFKVPLADVTLRYHDSGADHPDIKVFEAWNLNETYIIRFGDDGEGERETAEFMRKIRDGEIDPNSEEGVPQYRNGRLHAKADDEPTTAAGGVRNKMKASFLDA